MASRGMRHTLVFLAGPSGVDESSFHQIDPLRAGSMLSTLTLVMPVVSTAVRSGSVGVM
jgi:hypothetical protein